MAILRRKIQKGQVLAMRGASREDRDNAALRASPRDFQRFAKVITVTPECWNFTGIRHVTGYGSFGLQGTVFRAHRLTLLWKTGKAMPMMSALHKCHNRACVNPLHLYWGTHQDNSDDMRRDWTSQPWRKRGEAHGRALLKFDQAQELYTKWKTRAYTQKELADQYGVSESTVCHLCAGRTWTHIKR